MKLCAWLSLIFFLLASYQLFDSSITAHQWKGTNTNIDGGTGIGTSISTSLQICVTRDHWDSDCAHVALRDLEWLVAAPSFKTQCAIPVRKATTLRVIRGSMHVGPAPDAVILLLLLLPGWSGFFSIVSSIPKRDPKHQKTDQKISIATTAFFSFLFYFICLYRCHTHWWRSGN